MRRSARIIGTDFSVGEPQKPRPTLRTEQGIMSNSGRVKPTDLAGIGFPFFWQSIEMPRRDYRVPDAGDHDLATVD